MVIKLLSLSRISWPLFAMTLSHVHKVTSFVTCRKSTQAIRGQSASRFSLVMRELWGSITTEEQAEICRRMTD